MTAELMPDSIKNVDPFELPKPSVARIEPYLVRVDTSYAGMPTLMLRFEGLLELATYFVCVNDTAESSIDKDGYLGQYDFLEGRFHVVCPGLAEPEVLEELT